MIKEITILHMDDMDLSRLAKVVSGFQRHHYVTRNEFDNILLNPLIDSHMTIDRIGNITKVRGLGGYLKLLPDGIFAISEDKLRVVSLTNLLEEIFESQLLKIRKLYNPTIERIMFELS